MGVHVQNRTKTRLYGRAGFTLVEVMIVASIVAIGSAMAVPTYLKWTARYEVRQATTELAASLTMARMAARNRNTPMTATIMKAANGTYSVGFGNGASPMTLPNSVTNGSIILVTNLGPPAVTAVTSFAPSPPGNLGTIVFSPQGLRIGGGVGNQTVTLQTAQGTINSVVITPSGKVSACTKAACP